MKARQSTVTIALALAAAILCTGCPAMMIPGLAYSGYKYEHDKNNTAASTSSTQSNKSTSAQSHKSTASSQQQKIPDSEIE
jgi:hypothetical protein